MVCAWCVIIELAKFIKRWEPLGDGELIVVDVFHDHVIHALNAIEELSVGSWHLSEPFGQVGLLLFSFLEELCVPVLSFFF